MSSYRIKSLILWIKANLIVFSSFFYLSDAYMYSALLCLSSFSFPVVPLVHPHRNKRSSATYCEVEKKTTSRKIIHHTKGDGIFHWIPQISIHFFFNRLASWLHFWSDHSHIIMYNEHVICSPFKGNACIIWSLDEKDSLSPLICFYQGLIQFGRNHQEIHFCYFK